MKNLFTLFTFFIFTGQLVLGNTHYSNFIESDYCTLYNQEKNNDFKSIEAATINNVIDSFTQENILYVWDNDSLPCPDTMGNNDFPPPNGNVSAPSFGTAYPPTRNEDIDVNYFGTFCSSTNILCGDDPQDRVMNSNNWTASSHIEAIIQNMYYEFCLTTSDACPQKITNISFDISHSSGGPTNIMLVRNSDFTNAIETGTYLSGSCQSLSYATSISLTTETTECIRMYAWNSDGTPSNTGTLRVDDFTITTTPEGNCECESTCIPSFVTDTIESCEFLGIDTTLIGENNDGCDSLLVTVYETAENILIITEKDTCLALNQDTVFTEGVMCDTSKITSYNFIDNSEDLEIDIIETSFGFYAELAAELTGDFGQFTPITYIWSSLTDTVVNINENKIQTDTLEVVKFMAINSLGCMSNIVEINLAYPTSLASTLIKNFQIYPNPNQGQFILQAKNETPFSYKIYNALGQLIVEQKAANNYEVITLAEAGLYVVLVETKNGVWVEKVVVK